MIWENIICYVQWDTFASKAIKIHLNIQIKIDYLLHLNLQVLF